MYTTKEKQAYLAEQRTKRLVNLQGKFVIAVESQYDHTKSLYLRDMSIASRSTSRWTQYLNGAKGFNTEEEANEVLKLYSKGNPRIMKI